MGKIISTPRTRTELELVAKEYKKKLTDNPTESELVYQNYLKKNKVKFVFQKVIWNKEGSFYIVDFYIPVFNLIVEIDGSYHNSTEQINNDRHRSFQLKQMGYNVIRFTNDEVLKKYN